MHAELAVRLFRDEHRRLGDDISTAWLAVAAVLMTCNVWERGQWLPLFGQPVLMERNNYRMGANGPNADLRNAATIGDVLATGLGIPRSDLSSHLGIFWRHPDVAGLQPNNLRGHAFRSITADLLARFGPPNLDIREEVRVRDVFPGFDFGNRSKDARVDIAAFAGQRIVALLTTRWTYRHDRVDMIDEARAYLPAARAMNRDVRFYGVTAEIGTARLKKVIMETEPHHPSPAIHRLVHLNPRLPGEVIGKNGELKSMFSLTDLVDESAGWL